MVSLKILSSRLDCSFLSLLLISLMHSSISSSPFFLRFGFFSEMMLLKSSVFLFLLILLKVMNCACLRSSASIMMLAYLLSVLNTLFVQKFTFSSIS